MLNRSENRKLNTEGIQSLQDVLKNYTAPKSTDCRFNPCEGYSTKLVVWQIIYS